MNTKHKNENQPPKPAGGFNPLGVLGAAARNVVGIAKAVQNDLNNVPPPMPAAGQGPMPAPNITLNSDVQRMLATASAGLQEVRLDGAPGVLAPPAEPETPTPAAPAMPAGPPKLSPLAVLADPARYGQITLDCYFHAYAPEDITQYPAIISKETKPPFTFGLLTADAGQAVVLDALLKTIASHGRMFGAVGMGPRDVWDNLDDLDRTLTELFNTNPRLLAVGPIGLDANYAPAEIARQQAQLLRQLEIAADFGLPAFIFHRKAGAQLAATLQRAQALPQLIYLKPIQHADEIEFLRAHGAYLLLRAELTQPEFGTYRAVVKEWPREKLLLGAGSAITAPKQLAGQFNGPASLPHILQEASTLLNVPLPELRLHLNHMAIKLFFNTLSVRV